MGVAVADIVSRDRHTDIADARALACLLLHRKCLASSPRAGAVLGLDHATVLYHANQVRDWLEHPEYNPKAAEVALEIDYLTRGWDPREVRPAESRQWKKAEDDILLECHGKQTHAEISAIIAWELGIERTPQAVTSRVRWLKYKGRL